MSNRAKSSNGFTLPEIIISTSLISLLLSLAIPSLEQFAIKQTLSASANSLVGLIYAAKSRATIRGPILLCSDKERCSTFQEPASGLILVEDRNNNRQIDPGEIVEPSLQLRKGMTLYWRSFRAKPWLRINRRGIAYYQNGNYVLCYRGQSKKVILNYQARARVQKGTPSENVCSNSN